MPRPLIIAVPSDGVGAAADSCKDGDSENDDKFDEQMGACGDYEKLHGWWMV